MKNEIPTFKFVGSWQSPVPNSIIRNDKLTDRARMLWIFIRSYASPSSPVPFPKNSTMCRNLGWSRETLWKYMKELEGKGLMSVKRTEFLVNQYYLFDAPQSNFTESENFPLGKFPTAKKSDTKKSHTEEDDPIDGAKGKSVPLASQSDAYVSPPVVQSAARATGNRSKPTSSVKATAGAVAGEEDDFELEENGKALLNLWDEHYLKVFKRTYQHTKDDLVALQYLAEEASGYEMMGFILSAWSFRRKPEGEYDPYFYCTHYSNRPRDIWMTTRKDGTSNLDKMREEQCWRSRPEQIEFGYKWFAKIQGKQAVPAGS
jgi:hypothetical protein